MPSNSSTPKNYSTQLDAARKNIITPEMQSIAIRENLDPEKIRTQIAAGTMVIPANINHTSIQACAIGPGTTTKINVNLGISKDCQDYDLEIKKADRAIELKADAIMDLSCYGDTRKFRKDLIKRSPALIGTVPMYDAIGNSGKALTELTKDDFMKVVEDHARDGVDFVTIHAGMNRKTLERIKANKRLTNVVSRGGSMLITYMEKTENENPFYEFYDEFLAILEKYDVTISLGDGCRPGSLHDATDAAQIEELITLGELTKRAWAHNVQVMIEGPGHIPLHEVKTNIQLAKKLTHNAPLYVLGPLVTDIAAGHDHIAGAIGGAIAAGAGADFLCYLTPAEHLRLPDLKDMEEGIMATKIAAHAGDIAKGIPGAIEQDIRMSQARADIDWPGMYYNALDPEKAKAYHESSLPGEEDSCSMCGELCAMKSMKEILN